MRDCHIHAKTWELLRLTRMPAVRVDLGYLTSPTDRDRLIDPLFRDQIVEAILAAVQRMYYPVEIDVPDRLDRRPPAPRRPRQPGVARQFSTLRVAVAGRTGRSRVSGLIEPSSFSSAYSTSDFHDSAVRSSEPQPREARMRADRLEADRQEEVDRGDAAGVPLVVRLAELRVAERLDRLHARAWSGRGPRPAPASGPARRRRTRPPRARSSAGPRRRSPVRWGRPSNGGRRRAARTSRSRPACRRRRPACRRNPTRAGSATPRPPSPGPGRRTRRRARRRPGRAPSRHTAGRAGADPRGCPG